MDYEAIAMLNVSATQQIKKEKDAEVKALQEENAALRARLDAQEKRLAALEAGDQAREPRVAKRGNVRNKGAAVAVNAALNLK